MTSLSTRFTPTIATSFSKASGKASAAVGKSAAFAFAAKSVASTAKTPSLKTNFGEFLGSLIAWLRRALRILACFVTAKSVENR
jgi:hypothetical protein